MNHALAIQHQDIFLARTHLDQQPHRCHASGAGTHTDHLDVFDTLFLDFQRIDQTGTHHDGGTVLIIVEDRHIALLFKDALDLETLRRPDIFQVDTAKGAMDTHHSVDKGLGVFRVHFDIEHINTGKQLEQNPLAFHHRLGRQRTQIAKAQDGSAITDHGHQIALGSKAVGQLRLPGDLAHRFRHTRTIGQAQITAGCRRLGHLNADFPWPRFGVVFQGRRSQILRHAGLRWSLVGLNCQAKHCVRKISKQKAPRRVLFKGYINCGENAV